MGMILHNHRRRNEVVILAAVVNWNGWRATIDCMRSIFELPGPPFHLVICDNCSSDDSFEQLSNWLMKEGGADRQVERTNTEGVREVHFEGHFGPALKTVRLLGLQENFGYAGAINRCIVWGRQALMAQDFWILNNDVRVDSQALAQLTAVAHSSPDIGLCGSVLLDWNHPESVQAIGGMFRHYLAVGWHLRRFPTGVHSPQDTFFDIDYPVGASLYVTHEYLEAVGLMDESYFLYYEEMDWAERGRRRGFRPAVALKSLVQHKEGASTGSHGGVRNKSMLSEHYGVLNRLRITRKFWPTFLPMVWMSLWLVVVDRVAHGEWARARLVLQLMFDPRKWMRSQAT